jgi:hypothetical protein
MIVNWIDLIVKLMAGLGGLGFFIAAFSYRNQVKIRQAEWLKSLFEKFFENSTYKEVRTWLDYDILHARLMAPDAGQRQENEEKFTDFLNFFEFIGVLYSRGHLPLDQVRDVFDYYLEKIKVEQDCREWINKYSFEKLKALLASI